MRALFATVVVTLIGQPFPVRLGAEELVPRAPMGQIWEANLAYETDYKKEVEALLAAYETEVARQLAVGARGKVGIKVNSRGGRGLSTPLPLLRAVVEAMKRRGYARDSILIVDFSEYSMRAAGIMPPLSADEAEFEGSPLIALNRDVFFDEDWFYDSPLPPSFEQRAQFVETRVSDNLLEAGSRERKSFLPMPLLFDVDFWINLAVGSHDPSLGIDGALAGATLWNVSNSRRFLVNQATASAAVAEIAAIPELSERMVLHFMSLDTYQFIGGPFFNSIYTRSEPKLWMSSDPVALDRSIFERINVMRRVEGFPEIYPLPQQLLFAASLGLGFLDLSQIKFVPIQLEHESKPRLRDNTTPPRFEEPPEWLEKITPW